MELREPTAADGHRIAELVESAMTASYRLSPGQIDALIEDEFSPDAVTAKVESDGTLVRVLEVGGEAGPAPEENESDDEEPVIAGYVEGRLQEPRGEVRWLFVDPELRGLGIGTSAFDAAVEALTDAGATEIVATTFEANAEGGDFFDRLGFERVDERTIDVADETLHAVVYAEPGSQQASEEGTDADATTGADADSANEDAAGDEEEDQLPDDPRELDLPETDRADGATTARTEDGQQVFLAFEEMESGTDGPFFATYLDEAKEDPHGYYCSNCGSLSVTADVSDRIACPDCGNDHTERSSDAYDGAYL